ncbi:DNA primase [Caulobacter segnis]|uniref:DNA primase n=2 Tax=Caulobacter segnis TaxID=88688 RepID=D5VN94_CAUST|nr:DNA primase [Caulobacter segnis]ADG11967.1 DNA primase [Caulobacter segnis ATCC 21756]AVQ03588.1 DNA primase [Caulobacter segnis]
MRFDDRFLEELKSRLRPSDVVGKTVKLRRQGREYAGLSPFTKEKSPSFFVNDEKGFYHCFSSGKHGDIISFLQETERLTFAEAVERLAAEAGMSLPEVDPRAAREEQKRSSLGDWMELAAAWFESELRRPVGQAARAYLEKRGLPESEWSRFRIGFAPNNRTGLKDYLIAKGAKPGDLVDAGVLIAPEDGGQPYDRFRDRIIFPIADSRGKVVSFGGRAMDPAARAKYLNGPETSLFHKGRVLYGLFEARKILHAGQSGGEKPPMVVVEGYMDVIACQRAGIPAVAAMGTALTEEQMEGLWRLHPTPTLCFDGDKAGRRAADRAIDRALPLLKPGRSFLFSMPVGGKDPDDVLREQGPAALKAQISNTKPFVEALFERERELEPFDTPEQRTNLKVRLRTLAATIADKDLAHAYKEELLDRLDEMRAARRVKADASDAGRALSRQRWDNTPRRGGKGRLEGSTAEGRQAAAALQQAPRPFSAALLIAAIRDPKVVDDRIEVLMNQGFGDQRLDAIAQELVNLRMDADHVEAGMVRGRLATAGYDDATLAALERSAAHVKALDAAQSAAQSPEDAIRGLWSQAFDLLIRLTALERAVDEAKADLAHEGDSHTLFRLKTERDAVKRLIDSGGWTDPSLVAQVLH